MSGLPRSACAAISATAAARATGSRRAPTSPRATIDACRTSAAPCRARTNPRASPLDSGPVRRARASRACACTTAHPRTRGERPGGREVAQGGERRRVHRRARLQPERGDQGHLLLEVVRLAEPREQRGLDVEGRARGVGRGDRLVAEEAQGEHREAAGPPRGLRHAVEDVEAPPPRAVEQVAVESERRVAPAEEPGRERRGLEEERGARRVAREGEDALDVRRLRRRLRKRERGRGDEVGVGPERPVHDRAQERDDTPVAEHGPHALRGPPACPRSSARPSAPRRRARRGWRPTSRWRSRSWRAAAAAGRCPRGHGTARPVRRRRTHRADGGDPEHAHVRRGDEEPGSTGHGRRSDRAGSRTTGNHLNVRARASHRPGRPASSRGAHADPLRERPPRPPGDASAAEPSRSLVKAPLGPPSARLRVAAARAAPHPPEEPSPRRATARRPSRGASDRGAQRGDEVGAPGRDQRGCQLVDERHAEPRAQGHAAHLGHRGRARRERRAPGRAHPPRPARVGSAGTSRRSRS